MILITGKNGQLGQAIAEQSQTLPQFQFLSTDRSQLNIDDESQVSSFFKENSIDFCINTAAFTAVDKAETEQLAARSTNEIAVKHLAMACQKQGAVLIHISTDYVYDNGLNRPYQETDVVAPKSMYAKTKRDGEVQALHYNDKTIIIRTSWVYASNGHNFVKTMLRLGQSRDQLNVVFDQVGSPTYAPDLAFVILKIIEQYQENPLKGIYNFSNEGVTSWYDFALAIFRIKDISCQVNPIESKDYPTPAKRPFYSVMNKEKIKKALDIRIPHWEESLANCLKQL